ncbi:MAG: DUF998 domain-containing protein [Chloroflexi bacterium]|nr:DUF998 domain-containing protein [Chloroflexota bacterium]
MTTDAWIQAGGLLAALFAVAAAATVVALHVVRTDVDPFADGVSAFALTRFGALYRSQVIATGIAALLLAGVLVAGGFGAGGGVIVLVVFALSRIFIARYPTDPRGTTRFSPSGRMHVLLAATTFVTIAIAAPWIPAELTGHPAWPGPTGVLMALGWATALLALGTFATTTLPATRRVFGLVERGAYAAWMLWIIVAGLSVARPI